MASDEPGEQHSEAADLADDEQRHRHLRSPGGVFELVGGVAQGAMDDVVSDSADEKTTTTAAAVRFTQVGQALSSTKAASSNVANE